jgi:RimJ/RimL family protein N-acetyltransferase
MISSASLVLADGGRSFETERLYARPPTLDDLPHTTGLWTDPDVVRFITGRPSTREEVWARLLRYAGHWLLLDFGYWAVFDKESGRFVGEIGFADFRRDISPALDEGPEAGWVLAPWAHGRGLATEAMRGAHAWREARFGKGRTVCIISPNNRASIRVAEKCGYREVGTREYRGPIIVFARD